MLLLCSGMVWHSLVNILQSRNYAQGADASKSFNGTYRLVVVLLHYAVQFYTFDIGGSRTPQLSNKYIVHS